MPIYDFYCSNMDCELYGVDFERYVNSMDLRNLEACENCNYILQVRISTPAFKGGEGFYNQGIVCPNYNGNKEDTPK